MASFAKASTQAQRAINHVIGISKPSHGSNDGKVHSVSTANAYREVLEKVAEWDKANGGTGLKNIDDVRAEAYLSERAEYVTQKTLDRDRQAMKVLPNVNSPERIKSEVINTGLATQSRAYTPEQVSHLVNHQQPHNALATEIAYQAGLRAHELFTIKPIAEQPISTHRTWTDERFTGREGVSYSVIGKGGLIREVKLSLDLANRLEQTRLATLKDATDRKINYTKVYDIGAGKNWSVSYSKASKREFGWTTGAHGLRHSYAQKRMNEIQSMGHTYQSALEIVSQELGHFRADITETYLR